MDPELIKKLKFCFGKSPKEVVDYLKSQNVEISWDWKEQLDIIKRHSFTVSKVFSADILQTILDMVTQAAEDGKSFKEFKEELTEKLNEKGFSSAQDTSWRLDIIYRTNLQSAYMAGRYYQMKAVEEDFPYWQIIAVMDIRTRPSHAAIHGKVVRSDDPIWDTIYPPNGYACRCRTRALSQVEMDRKRLRAISGDRLNFKPDEGFEASPASEWKPDLRKYSPEIRKTLNTVLKGA